VQVNNPTWDFVTSIGDVTNWGAEYGQRWRAVVTFKLIRNRPGPVDKRVDTVERWLTKGMFAEQGVGCGVVRSPGFGSGPVG